MSRSYFVVAIDVKHERSLLSKGFSCSCLLSLSVYLLIFKTAVSYYWSCYYRDKKINWLHQETHPIVIGFDHQVACVVP